MIVIGASRLITASENVLIIIVFNKKCTQTVAFKGTLTSNKSLSDHNKILFTFRSKYTSVTSGLFKGSVRYYLIRAR